MLRRLAAVAVPLAAVGMAGCGGGGGGTGHDSPEATVRGLVAALQSGDISAACDWVAPSQRAGCTQNLAAARALGPGVSFRVDNFAIKSTDTDSSKPDKATVHVDGSFHLCVSGQCVDSAALLASQGSDAIPTVKEQGQWWVSGLGGEVGAEASPPSSDSSSTDTGTSVTTETGGPTPAPTDTGGAGPVSPTP